MATVDTAALQARRAQMNAEIQRHEEAILALESKRDELDIALRVIAEYEVPATESAKESRPPQPSPNRDTVSLPSKKKKTREAKPSGIPEMPTMIRQALKRAHETGKSGLEPIEITEYIRERFWGGCPTSAVGPIAWRMWNRQELEKHEKEYALPGWERLITFATGVMQRVTANRSQTESEKTGDLLSSATGVE